MFHFLRNALTKSEMLAIAGNPDAKSARIAARNTLVFNRDNGARVVQLHRTQILELRPNGSFTICTGGYNTKTTRERLNAFLPGPWSVHTEKGVIHLRNRQTGEEIPFKETITVGARGAIKPDVTPRQIKSERARIDAFMAHIRKTGLPTIEKSQGDPWVFSKRTVSPYVMQDWIDNKYFTRTMYALAIKYAGLTDFAASMFMNQIDRRGGKLDATDLRRIRRYIRACMGMET